MQAIMTQDLGLEQTLSPRMIQFYQMLQCPAQELGNLILQELEVNPALELVELAAEPEPAEVEPERPNPVEPSGWATDDDDLLARLPAPVSLREHLRQQFLALAQTPQERQVGLRMIEEVNLDGYFEGQIGELALLTGQPVTEVERVLGLLQRLDPPGVGARDLRECLLIQVHLWAADGQPRTVVTRLLEDSFEAFGRCQYPTCARQLRVPLAAVEEAAEWLRKHCHPYPGRDFRLPWQDAPSPPQARPEVWLQENPDAPPAYLAELRDSERYAVRIDRVYRRLYRDIENGLATAEGEADHVLNSVRRARQFIQAIGQRRETVRRITEEVANLQADYVAHGPGQLRPLTRLEVARRLGVHESTVGRAVAGKIVQLPSGEAVPLASFFDGALPVKLALEQLINAESATAPLSDAALAAALTRQGFEVARRTVAKYRQELKIPPASQRRGR